MNDDRLDRLGHMTDFSQGSPSAASSFAAAEYGHGIAVFRPTAEGLRCDFSRDAMLWRTEIRPWEPDSALWPLCGAELEERGDLFCVDDSGMVFPVSVAEGSLSLSSSFRPIASAPPWYEALPGPHDVTILRDAGSDLYRAFFGTRRSRGRQRERRGCIGAATSTDLRTWTVEPPIFSPNKYPAMYSPDVFMEGGRAILFYVTSEQGNLRALRFALAPSLDGPYEQVTPDVLACDVRTSMRTVRFRSEGLAFFGRAMPGADAPQTMSRPGRIAFRPNGSPFVRFYDPLARLLGRPILETQASLTSSEILVRVLPTHARDFRMTARLRSLGAKDAGLVFRTTATGHDNITLWLEFERGALTLRRGVRGRHLGRTRRELLEGRDYRITVWAEGDFADVYLDDEWVLTGHTETRRWGGFGLAVAVGEARFEAVSVQAIHAS